MGRVFYSYFTLISFQAVAILWQDLGTVIWLLPLGTTINTVVGFGICTAVAVYANTPFDQLVGLSLSVRFV